MLDPLQYSRNSHFDYYQPLRSFLERPFPRTPEELWQMEQELHKTSAQVADQILLTHLLRAHEDKAFVQQAVDQAYHRSPVPLVHKGWNETSILLSGGSRVVLKTPYLRENHQGKRGPKRKKRGKKGSGIYPVLEALGIRDGVSPATRSEIALYTVQTASYQEAVELLERRGFSCDISTLARIAVQTAQTDISLRDAALSAAMRIPIPTDGPLVGKRVRISMDGGRVRTRKNRKGRKTKKGRHEFSTPWREPRIVVIDILDKEGNSDPLRLPLYDGLIGDAEATFWLLVGYLRLLGAARAGEVEFISDGADWIWERIDRLVTDAEIPKSILVEAIDFYHASEHLASAVELCRSLPKKKRTKLYKKLRHTLRHEPKGVEKVIEELKALGTTRRGKKMKKTIGYFEKHAHRMDYPSLDARKLPVGSGQVESAVRRVVNLRFKAPGSFWKEKRVSSLIHLRAHFKAGRWEELMKRVLNREFQTPSFKPMRECVRDSLRAVSNLESPLEIDQQKAA